MVSRTAEMADGWWESAEMADLGWKPAETADFGWKPAEMALWVKASVRLMVNLQKRQTFGKRLQKRQTFGERLQKWHTFVESEEMADFLWESAATWSWLNFKLHLVNYSGNSVFKNEFWLVYSSHRNHLEKISTFFEYVFTRSSFLSWICKIWPISSILTTICKWDYWPH